MDGEHQYEINLKKDGLFINLSSDDVYFISKQMDKWFRILLDDSYVPVTLPQRPMPQAAPEPSVAPMPPQAPVYAEPAPQVQQPQPMQQPVMEPQAQYAQQPAPPVQAQPPQPMEVAAPMPQAAASQYAGVDLPMAQPQPAVQQQAAPPVQAPVMQAAAPQMPPQLAPQAPLPQMAAPPAEQPMQPMPVQQPVPQPQLAGVAAQGQAPLPQPPIAPAQDDFEAVMDTLMKDFEDPADELPHEAPEIPVYAPAASPAGYGGLPAEPDLSLITSLADLCDRSDASNSEDYLLLTAYYLTRIERQNSFSLKKVNTALVKSGLTPVNHSVLETVLSRGFLSMVPDLTGTAEVSEYMITAQGQQAAIQLL